MIETENQTYMWFKYDDEGIGDHPEWISTEVGGRVFPFGGGRLGYDSMYKMKPKFVPRERLDSVN